jgi:XTP/dITP diphosphohydrolase
MSLAASILFATSNPHKVQEVAAVLGPLGICIEPLSEQDRRLPEPVEDGRTFTANALIKARYYAQHTGRLAMADDSGLVVDALRGAPGVHSARYAAVTGPRSVVDAANNRKLLQELGDVSDEARAARFVCVMALCDQNRTWAVTRGEVAGRIIRQPRGTNGFGYDPLFLLPDRGITTAELSPSEKNAVSHRGQAARLMVQLLEKFVGNA